MSETHTPTPWTVREDGCIFWGPANVPCPTFVKIISPWRESAWDKNAEAQANAAFIVRAVNSHAALVEALEGLLGWHHLNFQRPDDHQPIVKARAALTLAKGS